MTKEIVTMETKYTDLDIQNQKNIFLEEILRQKLAQIENLKQGTKTIEAYVAGLKSISNRVKESWNNKKEESINMLLEQKLTPEAYKYFLETLESLNKFSIESEIEAEKLLFSKQCEINALSQEFNKLKELHKSGIEKLEEIKVLEVMAKKSAEREHRPDQDPNTAIGKAAIDLMARKRGSVESEDEADVSKKQKKKKENE